jgi:hypothetical protein
VIAGEAFVLDNSRRSISGIWDAGYLVQKIALILLN